MEELLSHITESFPDISNKAAWCSLIVGGIAAILSLFVKPLKREDRFGHPVAWISGIMILGISLAVIVFELSPYWLLLGLVAPPVWLALRWYDLARKLKKVRRQKKDRDILLHDYVDSLTEKKLFEWEIRRFLLPNLIVFFEIGAIKRLKTEIDNLKHYQTSEKVNELRSLICSMEHRPQEMTDLLKPKVIKRKCKPSDKDYPYYLNNLYHAAMMREDSIGIEYAFGAIENYVASVTDTDRIPVEMLEAMMYRYDTTNNKTGVTRTLALIASRKPKSFNEYLHLNDILLYHNKRHDNRGGIVSYIDQAYIKLDELEKDEEHRLRFRLRMVQLHFEYNYGWKEITIQLFKDADRFLSYSQDIAIEYVKMVANALRTAYSMYGQTLMPEQARHLITRTVERIEQYVRRHNEQLFELSDEFLYRKRDAYRFLIDLVQIKSLTDDGFDKIIVQTIESYEKIIELCLKNEEKSEYIQTLMAFIDEFIVQAEAVKNYMDSMGNDANSRSEKIIRSASPRIMELFDRYKTDLAESNFDRCLAYNTLYAAHFSMYFGRKEDAKFYLAKFEGHAISIKNFRAPIQLMYRNLKTALN